MALPDLVLLLLRNPCFLLRFRLDLVFRFFFTDKTPSCILLILNGIVIIAHHNTKSSKMKYPLQGEARLLCCRFPDQKFTCIVPFDWI